MASGHELEPTCSVCLDLYRDPVTIDCGHSFCRGCILKCWDRVRGRLPSCPVCRAQFDQCNVRPNHLLSEQVESVRDASEEPAMAHRQEREEAPGLNCPGSICSKSHPNEEQSEGPTGDLYQESLQGILVALSKQMEDIFKSQFEDKENLIKLKRKADGLRANIACEFAKLHQFLNEEQQALLPKLAQKEVAMLREIEENARKASALGASLNQTITDIQKRLRLRETGSLEDIESITDRIVKSSKPSKAFVGLDLSEFGGPSEYRLWKRMLRILDPVPAPLTMDPRSAHPLLLLSDDQTQVMVSSDPERQLSDGPERFSDYPSVLGSEGFASGRHYWEVEVGGNTAWDVGVARESVRGKELLTLETTSGVWAVALWFGKYMALTSPRSQLALSVKPKKLGVYLDYAAGQVSLYDADRMTHLYTFTDHFTERIYPYFNTYCSSESLKVTALQI